MSSNFYVVTVVMNDRQGLIRTRDSLIKQSSHDFVWIVVDGSTPKLDDLHIFNDEAWPQVSYRWQSPRGIYSAMNFSLRDLNDGWILFLNAGDIFASEDAVKQVQIDLREVSKQTFSVGYAVDYVSATGSVWYTSYPKVLKTNELNHRIAQIGHQGFIARIETMKKIGGFDEQLLYAADGKLMDKIVSLGDYHLSSFILTEFLIGGRSSKNFRKVLKEISTYRVSSNNHIKSQFNVAWLTVKNLMRRQVIKSCARYPRIETLILRLRRVL